MIAMSLTVGLEKLRLWLFWASWLSEIFYYSLARFWFGWLALRGQRQRIHEIKTRVVGQWTQRILSRLDCRIEIEGIENIPASGPLVVMSNHQSMYDIPLLMGHMGRMIGFVTKKELARIPGFGYWMRQIGCVTLDRSNPRAAAQIYREVAEQMNREGTALVLFPEGTRTRHPDGEIGPFKEGSLRLAAQGEIPILPISIDGTRFFSNPEALNATKNGGRLVRVRIAPPVVPSAGASSLERREFMARLRDTISGNFDQIRVSWPAPQDSAKGKKEGA